MRIRTVLGKHGSIAVVESDAVIIRDVQSAWTLWLPSAMRQAVQPLF